MYKYYLLSVIVNDSGWDGRKEANNLINDIYKHAITTEKEAISYQQQEIKLDLPWNLMISQINETCQSKINAEIHNSHGLD